MNAEHLLTHFDRIADAPDAIPRLRRFILDLAVRGKLVEQDPNDEPAAELLKRIAAEKTQLGREKRISKQAPFLPPDLSEIPFDLPDSWDWCPSTYPSYGVSDKGKKVQTKDIVETGKFPVVDQGKVPIRGYHNDPSKVIRIEAPIVLFGDHTREVKLIDFDFIVGADGVKLLQPVSLHTPYYFLALQWLPLASRGYGRHFKLLKESFIPLPPLAEQHRLVAKVDELMALCDRLETAQKERETTRNRLAAASLARLNAPDSDPTVFQNHAAFALNNLAPLTTRPDQIKALRQTILNLAVRGKLVEQDPEDEPASALLEQLSARRAKERRRKNELTPLSEEEKDYGAPLGWKWVRFGEVFSIRTGFAFKSSTYSDSGIFVLRVVNFDQSGAFNLSDAKFFPPEKIDQKISQFALREGEILMVMVGGTIGKTTIVTSEVLPALLNQNMWRIRSFGEILNNEFEYLLIQSINQQIEDLTNSTHGHFAMSDYEQKPICLPPLAEQRRLVAKVDELMALCDRLEASLAAGDETRGRLVDTLLHEVLEPATDREATPQPNPRL